MNTRLPYDMQMAMQNELDSMYMDPRYQQQMMGQQMGQQQPPQQQPSATAVDLQDNSQALANSMAIFQQQMATKKAAEEAASQKQGSNLMGAVTSGLGSAIAKASTPAPGGPAPEPPAAPLDTSLPGGTPTAAGVELANNMKNPEYVGNTAPGANPSWWDNAKAKVGTAWDNYKANGQASFDQSLPGKG